MSRRQANRWSEQDQSAYAEPQYAQPQYAQPQVAPPQYAQPAAVAAPDPIAQLKQLAERRNQGILTDAEFAAQKAKILAS